jgi:hypothetical protein
MTMTQPKTHRVGRMVDATHSLEMHYLENGVPCEGGRTYHVLSQVCDDGTQNQLARIDATVVTVMGEAKILWYINAPGYEYDMPHVWIAVRAWDTEGDAIDALWRLRKLAKAGQLPLDLRDAI